MPAKELSPEQKKDAKQLQRLFKEWKEKRALGNLPNSQQWVADAMGFGETSGQSTVSQYLTGKIPLNKPVAIKFAALIGCEVSAFSPAIALEILHDGWPFPQLERQRFYALEKWQRDEIQGLVRDKVERFETPAHAKTTTNLVGNDDERLHSLRHKIPKKSQTGEK